MCVRRVVCVCVWLFSKSNEEKWGYEILFQMVPLTLTPFSGNIYDKQLNRWSKLSSCGWFFFFLWNLNATLSYSIYHQPGVAQQEKWDHFPLNGRLSLLTFILLPTSCFSLNMSAASELCQILGDRVLSPLGGRPSHLWRASQQLLFLSFACQMVGGG